MWAFKILQINSGNTTYCRVVHVCRLHKCHFRTLLSVLGLMSDSPAFHRAPPPPALRPGGERLKQARCLSNEAGELVVIVMVEAWTL